MPPKDDTFGTYGRMTEEQIATFKLVLKKLIERKYAVTEEEVETQAMKCIVQKKTEFRRCIKDGKMPDGETRASNQCARGKKRKHGEVTPEMVALAGAADTA